MELKLIPDALLEIILQNGNHLESLCLDWWEITGQQLLAILTAHSELKIVEVALGAGLGSIMSIMPKTLGTSSLQRMVISTDPGVHPPAQTVTKSRVPYVNHADSDLPQRLHDKINAPDPNLPDIKELRKLAGRLPRLLQLVWTGPGGRGHWTFNRKPKSSLIGVSFVHSAVKTRDIWERCQESAPCFDYPDIIEERSTVTGLDASVAPCQCPDSVSSTPVMQEPLLARSTTDGPKSAMRLPRSPVATLRPTSPVGADSNLARRRDATPSKSMKHEPRHQSRRVSEPISHDRTNRKSTSNKRDNLGLTTPSSTARVEVNRSTTSTSQPTTPISPTGQLRSPRPVVPSQRGRGGGGGGRGHQTPAAIRTRHISESASAASYLASATSASAPVPSVSSPGRIVPGSGGRSAPAIDALGRVHAARPPTSSPPSKSDSSSNSSTSRSSLPGQSSAASGSGRGTANDDGWTVVGGLTKPISKSQVKAEDKKDDKGNAKMKVKVGLKERKGAKGLEQVDGTQVAKASRCCRYGAMSQQQGFLCIIYDREKIM
ncbi:hypothetical protein I316_04241 [Kwoniella heveanensis BCC8398]|uniref:Uncharacterized protein n=1 Tax=Kwoniella heveanensis BCC8398 TaxID=1296120 RepID=A0A1B9GS51_9TREE|nr:hypothetical protein I316_04241 [Kwoniella heveanensis BCC8398]